MYLVQGQHVEVTDVVLLSMPDPRPALLLVDHLSHILAHKLPLRGEMHCSAGSTSRQLGPTVTGGCVFYLLDVMDAAKAPAPGQRPEDLHLAVLTFGERLVEAALTCWTNLRVGKVKIRLRCQSEGCREGDGGLLYLGVAFIQQHAVDALGLHPTGALVRGLAVTARDL